MRVSLFTLSAVLGVLFAATASASDRAPPAQSSIKSAQSYGCVLECRDKGWGEDQCKAQCKFKEGG